MGTKSFVYATSGVKTERKLDMLTSISLGAVCVTFDDPENIICTIPTHTAIGSFMRSCMRRQGTHRAPTGQELYVEAGYASNRSCMRTELYV